MFQTETQTLLVYSWLKIPNHLVKGQSEHFLCFISLQQTVSHQLRGASSFQHYQFPLFQKLWRSVVGLVCKPNRLPYLCSQVGHLRWLPNCKCSFGNNSLELNSPPLPLLISQIPCGQLVILPALWSFPCFCWSCFCQVMSPLTSIHTRVENS